MTTGNGAVACQSILASEAGAEMLRLGGSAADALIATQLVVGTQCHYHSGICGGGFALARQPDGEYKSYDFRVAAPAEAKGSLFKNVDATIFGGLSVAVPGELRGFEKLHAMYGKLPWAKLFEPAIKMAREGIEVNQDLINMLRVNTNPQGVVGASIAALDDSGSWVLKSPDLANWLAPNGTFPELGSKLYRKEFANTLEKIAAGGADAFYTGEIAQSMVDHCRKEGGVLSMQDLADFKVRENAPLAINYRGRKVVSTPAPSSGSCLLLGLSVLSNFDTPVGPKTVEDTHRIAEACHWAYANRTELGDPAFVPGLVDTQNKFVAPETGRAYYQTIDATKTHPVDFYNTTRKAVMEDNGTSHIVASDADGLVISMTTTITCLWGSRLITPDTGIVLNDGMSDFAVEGFPNFTGYEPSPANFIVGGKRTLSTTCPFIIEHADGTFAYAGGAAGGSRILSSNMQHARNVLDYNMGPADALAHPRLHDQLLPNITLLEPSFGAGMGEELTKLGHKIQQIPMATSVGCGIAWSKEKGWEAAGEPRLKNSGGVVV
ncbi:hypothetical protein MNV49_006820 [Pseudohyphozyma bogoriensis]|nr:hypothetical protein MNV49_006820 [Pseudohyphozyma bogoriensis]